MFSLTPIAYQDYRWNLSNIFKTDQTCANVDRSTLFANWYTSYSVLVDFFFLPIHSQPEMERSLWAKPVELIINNHTTIS